MTFKAEDDHFRRHGRQFLPCLVHPFYTTDFIMRKLILIALAVMAGASFDTAEAASKKKKEQKVAPQVITITPKTAADSLGYTAGVVRTEGLLPFITQQYSVDTTYMADFIKGYEEAVANANTGKAKAFAAGQQVAFMVKERMLPFLKEEFANRKDSIDDAMFHLGFTNTLKHDNSVMTDSVARDYFDKAFRQAVNERNEANRKAGEDFLTANKAKDGVKTTASGLQYKVLREGNGKVAKVADDVTVKYEGRLIDGTVFDSSYKRPGETSKFKPNQVIKGWTEALTMMPEGSKWELYIPQELAYGDRQAGKIKPYSALIFIVEVVSVGSDDKETNAQKATAKTGKTGNGKKIMPAKRN